MSDLTSLLEKVDDRRRYDLALDRAMTRAEVCRPTVWANGHWLAAGITEYFQQQYDILRELDPTLPHDLPRQCMDINEMSRFVGIPLTAIRRDQGMEQLILALIGTTGVEEEALRRASIFKRFGDHWVIRFVAGNVVEFGIYDDHKGFQYYARLLADEGHETRSLTLYRLCGQSEQWRGRIAIANKEDGAEYGELTSDDEFRPQGEFTEETARNMIARLDSVRADIDLAKKNGDEREIKKLQVDEQLIVEYLKDQDTDRIIAAVRSGRRRIGSANSSEKAHDAVEKAMRRARHEVADEMPMLATFLKRNVEPAWNGFVYRPDPTAPKWLL